MTICAVLLAAGESRRMGRPKLLLPFGEKKIIEHIVDSLLQSKADKILVILGSQRKKIQELISDRPVLFVVNHRFREGMLSSIQAGFQALPEETSAALVCLGDQPLVPSSVFDHLIEEYVRTEKGIVIPVHDKRRGHPILIDSKYKQEILKISPDVGLRALVHGHPQDVHEVEVQTPHILKDIDYPEDYLSELGKKEKR